MTIADRLFTNARFHTLDPDNPNAEALASWRGRNIGGGARADLEALTGPGTEVLDLRGATVLPGFFEAHMHPIAAGVQMLAPQIGYPDCRTVADVLAVLGERGRSATPGLAKVLGAPAPHAPTCTTSPLSTGVRKLQDFRKSWECTRRTLRCA